MDIVERENVNIKNAVIISGITLTEADQTLELYLQRFGSIQRRLLIDDPLSDFHRNAIIEFSHNSAMCNLEPQLPLNMMNPSDPDVVFRVRALTSVHTPVTSSAQAAASDEESPDVHNTQMSAARIVQQPEECKTPPVGPKNPASVTLNAASPCYLDDADIQSTESIHVKFPLSAANPPSVQRVVMEHIIRASDPASSHSASFRLKSFSGRVPRPNNEPDFDTWRATVDYLLNDPSLPESHKTRKIFDCLLPPASDVIKHVNPNAPLSEFLGLLESVYGSVEDGDELLAKFISTLQNLGEKSSTYLHRLHVILCATIRRGGVAESERDRCLLKQFCRGCWDNALITDLQLEKRKANPLPFADLAILIRTAEDKQASKEERMRKHLGGTRNPSIPFKQRAVTHQQSVCPCSVYEEPSTETPALCTTKQKVSKHKGEGQSSETTKESALMGEIAALRSQIADIRKTADQNERERAETNELEELRRQVAELKVQVATPNQHDRPYVRSHPDRSTFNRDSRRPDRQPQYGEMRTNRPRPWYCFNCGDDAHIAINCENAPNPSRVDEKRRKLKERQAEWDSHNRTMSAPLN